MSTVECKGFKMKLEKIDGGYHMLCYRISDNFILVDEWNPSVKTKRDAIEECKITIEDFLKNPEYYI